MLDMAFVEIGMILQIILLIKQLIKRDQCGVITVFSNFVLVDCFVQQKSGNSFDEFRQKFD